jgi:hypothetical protein
VEKDGSFQTVRVKTVAFKSPADNYQVELRTSGGNKTRTTIKKLNRDINDLLFILTECGKKYLIPTKERRVRSSVTLSKKYDQYVIE